MRRRPRVAVVGAGVGGLAAAARLAHSGFEVDVFEKHAGPGGRCGRLVLDGFTFDTGPTVLLLPQLVERTFAAAGTRLSDFLTLERLEPNHTVHFPDGTALTLGSDLARVSAELESLAPGSTPGFLRFLGFSERAYRTTLRRFVLKDFDHPGQLLAPGTVRDLLAVRGHRSLASVVARFIRDERLRAAVSFQTMYLGMSPFRAPAVHGLLPFCEMGVGVYFPRGGLHALPLALERLGRGLGVRFHYRTEVRRILTTPERARGVELAEGTRLEADLVLCNVDLPFAYRMLLDPHHARLRRPERLRYTSSALVLYLGLGRTFPGLGHHTVFLGRDFRGSFEDIFRRGRVPADPSFYLAVASRTDPSLAPPGKDGVYVLVPVPHRHPSLDWAVEGPRVREKVFSRLAGEGFPLERHVRVERTFTPDDWEASYGLEKGSAFGLSMNLGQVGPFRPPNRDRNLANLFFVGASTQPGSGLPTVMVSAELVVERMLAHARAAGFLLPTRLPSGEVAAA